jgi:hypothetical protein
MTENEIQEKYKKNCMIIGEAVYRNSLNNHMIRQLINQNIEFEKNMSLLKGKPAENNTPAPSTQD